MRTSVPDFDMMGAERRLDPAAGCALPKPFDKIQNEMASEVSEWSAENGA